MKNSVVIGVVILTLLSCGFIFKANQDLEAERAKLVRERYLRMEAEEGLQRADGKVKSLERELTDSRDKLESIKGILDNGQTENVSLKGDLEALKKAKEELEQKVMGLESITEQKAADPKTR